MAPNKININIYFLFDLAVILTMAMGIKNMPISRVLDTLLTTTTTVTTRKEEETKIFPVGSVVEVYDKDMDITPMPAVITGIIHGADGQYVYNTRHGITLKSNQNVLPKLVHQYQIYEKGTKAQCNIGKDDTNLLMVPCVVRSHTLDKDKEASVGTGNNFDSVVYEVQEGDDILVLPRFKVQRLDVPR